MPDLSPSHSSVSYHGLCIDQASEDRLLANSSQGPWTLPLLNLALQKDEQPKDLKHLSKPERKKERREGRGGRERERKEQGQILGATRLHRESRISSCVRSPSPWEMPILPPKMSLLFARPLHSLYPRVSSAGRVPGKT